MKIPKKKLVIITPYFSQEIGGGIASYVIGLYNVIRENYSSKISASIIVETEIHKNQFFNFLPITSMFKILINLIKLRPDVIHSHQHLRLLIPSIIYKILYPNTKLIHTFHEYLFEKKSIISLFYELALLRYDVVTFVSKSQLLEIEKNLEIRAEKKIIRAGVTLKGRFEKINAINCNLKQKDNLSLSFIGNLSLPDKVKGVELLIDAVKKVISDYPNTKLFIVGEGIFKGYLRELVENLELEDSIIFLGYTNNVFEILQFSDIYTHIGYNESLGITLLEAMYTRTPIIALKNGAIPEVINEDRNGILVEDNSDSIAKAIIELYENKSKMRRISFIGHKILNKYFSWIEIGNDFVNLYLT